MCSNSSGGRHDDVSEAGARAHDVVLLVGFGKMEEGINDLESHMLDEFKSV